MTIEINQPFNQRANSKYISIENNNTNIKWKIEDIQYCSYISDTVSVIINGVCYLFKVGPQNQTLYNLVTTKMHKDNI